MTPLENKSNMKNANKGTKDNNEQNSKLNGNKGKLLNPTYKKNK